MRAALDQWLRQWVGKPSILWGCGVRAGGGQLRGTASRGGDESTGALCGTLCGWAWGCDLCGPRIVCPVA
eukprot:3142723-Prymnesium_polylepis.2